MNYKSLGLVNTREMFAKAIKGGYAIPAFNFNNMEQLQAIITASSELKSPVILQVSKGARNYANPILLEYMAQGAVEFAKSMGCKHPEIVLHLDHGDSFELCKSCVDMGFSSVMIDGSALPYDENVALTKKVVEYAHQFDVTVEGELGVLAGVEDEVSAEESHYTKPEEVQDFVSKTGVDSLAISIGTSHGAYKFKPEQCTRDPKTGRLVPPPLAFDVLDEIMVKLPGFPIVLHGSSSVPQEYVDMIELNISCPHAMEGYGASIGQDCNLSHTIVSASKDAADVPIIAKLTPNVTDITEIAKTCEDAGADALSLINTLGPGMKINIDVARPVLFHKSGGMSGRAIKPIAVSNVYSVYEAVDIPLIGVGGIYTFEDVVEFIFAGAKAVQIGTAIMDEGVEVFSTINEGLEKFMAEKGYSSIDEMVGLAHREL